MPRGVRLDVVVHKARLDGDMHAAELRPSGIVLVCTVKPIFALHITCVRGALQFCYVFRVINKMEWHDGCGSNLQGFHSC